jgi:hypothetical protein
LLFVELLYALLLGLHLLVLLEVLNVFGMGEVFQLGVFVVVPFCLSVSFPSLPDLFSSVRPSNCCTTHFSQ